MSTVVLTNTKINSMDVHFSKRYSGGFIIRGQRIIYKTFYLSSINYPDVIEPIKFFVDGKQNVSLKDFMPIFQNYLLNWLIF